MMTYTEIRVNGPPYIWYLRRFSIHIPIDSERVPQCICWQTMTFAPIMTPSRVHPIKPSTLDVLPFAERHSKFNDAIADNTGRTCERCDTGSFEHTRIVIYKWRSQSSSRGLFFVSQQRHVICPVSTCYINFGTMTARSIDEHSPLLSEPRDHSDASSFTATSTITDDAITHKDAPTRSVADDVLPETSTLGRTLNWNSSYILVISRIIGSGIFATPGSILQSVGSPGLALLLWVLGAVVTAAGLAILLEYGSMLPRSGGHKVYLEYTFRRPRFLASTIVAIQAVFLGFTASNCVIFSQYTLYAVGYGHGTGALEKYVAVGMLTVVTVIHTTMPKFGVKLQNLLGWVKIGIVIFMIFCGLYVVIFRPDTDTKIARSPVTWDRLWQDSNWNWGILCTALFKVFYSYAGLENISNVLNEVKDPVKTLRSVTRTALATACVMYFLVNIAYFLVVPLDDIKSSGELIAALFFQRIFGANFGGRVLPLVVALSAFGNVLVVVFAMVSSAVSLKDDSNCSAGAIKTRSCTPRISTIFGDTFLYQAL